MRKIYLVVVITTFLCSCTQYDSRFPASMQRDLDSLGVPPSKANQYVIFLDWFKLSAERSYLAQTIKDCVDKDVSFQDIQTHFVEPNLKSGLFDYWLVHVYPLDIPYYTDEAKKGIVKWDTTLLKKFLEEEKPGCGL